MIQNNRDVQKSQRARTFDRHPFMEGALPPPLKSGTCPWGPAGCNLCWTSVQVKESYLHGRPSRKYFQRVLGRSLRTVQVNTLPSAGKKDPSTRLLKYMIGWLQTAHSSRAGTNAQRSGGGVRPAGLQRAGTSFRVTVLPSPGGMSSAVFYLQPVCQRIKLNYIWYHYYQQRTCFTPEILRNNGRQVGSTLEESATNQE